MQLRYGVSKGVHFKPYAFRICKGENNYMYYALKTDCYYRKYDEIGYIVRPIVEIEEVVNDTAAIFLETLSYTPKHIDEIVSELGDIFDEIDISEIKKDVMCFFDQLVNDGFLNSDNDIDSFKNTGFEYSTLEGKVSNKNFSIRNEETSSVFLEGYFRENPHLNTFHIELTSKCNERCVHCYIPHENKNTDIDTAFMLDILEQCKEMGVITVVFSGGEPMLHPDFCKLLHYAKKLDLNVTVLSNLTLLTEEVLNELSYRHATCVNVSLYSMISEVHDAITGVQGSFFKTKNNILKLIENNIPVQINCPIMKQNKDNFYEVINWGQEHKCAVITDYLIMARYDGSIDNLKHRITNDDIADVIKHILENDAIFQEKTKNNNGIRKIKAQDRVCGVGITTLCMVADGKAYPCAGWQKYICGDLKKNKLSDIWKNSEKIQYLRNLKQGDFETCSECEDKEYCLMCMGRNANEAEDGDIFKIPKITCEATKIYHKMIDKYLQNQEDLK